MKKKKKKTRNKVLLAGGKKKSQTRGTKVYAKMQLHRLEIEGSVVKTIYCHTYPCLVPSSELPATLAPGDPTPSPGLHTVLSEHIPQNITTKKFYR